MGVKSHWLDQMSEGKMTRQIQLKSACPVVVSAYTYTTENNEIRSDVFAHWMTHQWRQRCRRNSNWSVHIFTHRWKQKMFYTLQAQEEHVDNTGIVRKLRTRSSEPPTWTKASNEVVHNNCALTAYNACRFYRRHVYYIKFESWLVIELDRCVHLKSF